MTTVHVDPSKLTEAVVDDFISALEAGLREHPTLNYAEALLLVGPCWLRLMIDEWGTVMALSNATETLNAAIERVAVPSDPTEAQA